MPVKSWAQFERRVRARAPKLFIDLPNYSDSVLVAGCQRSGTTVITRLIRRVIGMPDFEFTKDDELDAALVLAGVLPSSYTGRHCFQTTYLNEQLSPAQVQSHQLVRKQDVNAYSVLSAQAGPPGFSMVGAVRKSLRVIDHRGPTG